jgi:hypothetical protein
LDVGVRSGGAIQWEKKQLAEKEKKQEAKKRSKCAIAKYVVLVRQAS